jgi:hypothetical protein
MGTWWIDEPGLVGSANPTDADLERLHVSGFSVIVCLLDLREQTTRSDTRRVAEAGWEWRNIAKKLPADQRTAERQKGLVDVGPPSG